MVQFIELTLDNGKEYIQEIHHIIGIFGIKNENNLKTQLTTSDGEFYYVKETPAEIMEKIAAAQND